MRIYFAGEGYSDIQGKHNSNVLISFFYMDYRMRHNDLKKKYGWDKLFIDSGAFSAWSQKARINIDQYIHYIKSGFADYYAVLDKIGSAEGTYKNQKYMESQGVKPLPCFHYGEDWEYLDNYCNSYDYVCLGGMVPISTPQLIKWLDVIFMKYPSQKFHGFGLTSTRLVSDYPWYSVDSSTWIAHMKFNEIHYHKYGRMYLGKTKEEFNKIFKKPSNQKWVDLIEKHGFKKEELFDNYRRRVEFNLIMFQNFEKFINETKPFKKEMQGILDCKIPKFDIPKNKVKHSSQMTLLNSNLGRLTKSYKFFIQCVVCNQKYDINPNNYVKKCKFCGSNFITSPQKEVIWVKEGNNEKSNNICKPT